MTHNLSRRSLLIAGAATGLVGMLGRPAAATPRGGTAFTNVTVIDPASGRVIPNTTVTIVGEDFYINGRPTYVGRNWRGHRIEGLLLNSRMVQATFDDRNTNTIARWAYPDTGRWDADRNTREFIAAMPDWRRHGLLAVTLNLQGGSPEGYSRFPR